MAAALGQLLAAEEAGLIDPDAWRDRVDVPEMQRYVTERLGDLVAKWDADFDSLRRWFGERLIYEEALMFLTRRSSLESAGRFVDAGRLERLAATDTDFSATLHANTEAMRSARQAPGLALTHRLPGHWWWRGDSEVMGAASISG